MLFIFYYTMCVICKPFFDYPSSQMCQPIYYYYIIIASKPCAAIVQSSTHVTAKKKKKKRSPTAAYARSIDSSTVKCHEYLYLFRIPVEQDKQREGGIGRRARVAPEPFVNPEAWSIRFRRRPFAYGLTYLR